MDRIGPPDTAALVDALRQVSRKATSTTAPRTATGGERPDLRAELARLVTDVDPDDDSSMARARRTLLKAILLREWGEGAESDPAFVGMLEAVDNGIGGDGRLRGLLRDAVISLKRST